MENERNVAEYESNLASIDRVWTYYDSTNRSISNISLKEIKYGSYIHPDINARDARLKIRDHIKLAVSGWKEAELSENRMDKGLHKVFKVVVN